MLAGALKALGHPARLAIMRVLAEQSRQCCCGEVTHKLPLAQSTVSQHLKVLLDAGLIERHPDGTRNRYCLCSQRIAMLRERLGEALDGLGGIRAETTTAKAG